MLQVHTFYLEFYLGWKHLVACTEVIRTLILPVLSRLSLGLLLVNVIKLKVITINNLIAKNDSVYAHTLGLDLPVDESASGTSPIAGTLTPMAAQRAHYILT